jgi:hypothetical protein
MRQSISSGCSVAVLLMSMETRSNTNNVIMTFLNIVMDGEGVSYIVSTSLQTIQVKRIECVILFKVGYFTTSQMPRSKKQLEGKNAIPVLTRGLPTKAVRRAGGKVTLKIEKIQEGYRYEAKRDGSSQYYTCVVKKINKDEKKFFVEWEDGTASSHVKIHALRFRLVTLSDSE